MSHAADRLDQVTWEQIRHWGSKQKQHISIEWWLWKADGNGQTREQEVKKSSLCRQSFQVFLQRGMDELDGKWRRI